MPGSQVLTSSELGPTLPLVGRVASLKRVYARLRRAMASRVGAVVRHMPCATTTTPTPQPLPTRGRGAHRVRGAIMRPAQMSTNENALRAVLALRGSFDSPRQDIDEKGGPAHWHGG